MWPVADQPMPKVLEVGDARRTVLLYPAYDIVTLEECSIVDQSPIADLYSTASLRLIASPLRIGCLPRIADLGLNVCLFACLFVFSRRPSCYLRPCSIYLVYLALVNRP